MNKREIPALHLSTATLQGDIKMPAHYPAWNDSTPDTDTRATATRSRSVKNVPVVHVLNGSFRSSKTFEGTFELVDYPDNKPKIKWGAMRAQVYCAWHSVRSPRGFPSIKIGEGSRIEIGFTGNVVDNIS